MRRNTSREVNVASGMPEEERFGGSMYNNVVETIVRAGQSCGLANLRFNFAVADPPASCS
jgi:alpha/beta superfamily hydrolase